MGERDTLRELGTDGAVLAQESCPDLLRDSVKSTDLERIRKDYSANDINRGTKIHLSSQLCPR